MYNCIHESLNVFEDSAQRVHTIVGVPSGNILMGDTITDNNNDEIEDNNYAMNEIINTINNK